MTIKGFCFVVVMGIVPTSCKALRYDESSNTEGFSGLDAGAGLLKKPPLRSPMVISTLKANLVCRHLATGSIKAAADGPRKILQNNIIREVAQVDGVPRVQIEHALADLVDPVARHCDGASCASVFSLRKSEISHFLDETAKLLAGDARLRNAENKELRAALLGSFTKQSLNENLLLGEPQTWHDFVRTIVLKGTPDDELRNGFVPVMRQFDDATRGDLVQLIAQRYEKAYKNKFKVTQGLAPKRAYDVVLRYVMGPETYFKGVRSKEQTMTAWRKYFAALKESVFRGTAFSCYTPDDVRAVAQRMQSFLLSKGAAAKDVNILLKGSFPSGKANLQRKNPFDNLVDSVTTGFDTSYSDIDFLINADWEKAIKVLEPDIYKALVSQEGRDIVTRSKAKAFFQTHPDPFDLFAELDGSIMSPIGLRVNQQSITLVVYNPLSRADLPSREILEKMGAREKQALYKKWASFYPL